MHFENASSPDPPAPGAVEPELAAVVLVARTEEAPREAGVDAAPQAASTSEQPTTASDVASFGRPRAWLDVVLRIPSVCQTGRTSRSLYDRALTTGVTPLLKRYAQAAARPVGPDRFVPTDRAAA
jgi:hypothetical protein